MSNRIQGRVRWFDADKGFGFLNQPPDDVDIYCHSSEIQGGGPQVLTEGQSVEFEIQPGPKGPQARNVVPLD